MAKKATSSTKFNDYSKQELSDAKLGGFKRKKPNKPKTKTLAAIESYREKYNSWVKELKEAAKDGAKLRSARKALSEA